MTEYKTGLSDDPQRMAEEVFAITKDMKDGDYVVVCCPSVQLMFRISADIAEADLSDKHPVTDEQAVYISRVVDNYLHKINEALHTAEDELKEHGISIPMRSININEMLVLNTKYHTVLPWQPPKEEK